MQRLARKYPSFMKLVIVMFVVLVGVVGYTYVLNYRAEVATAPGQTNTIAAQTATIPSVEKSADLDTALDVLDEAAVDGLSEAELQALEAELDSL